MMRLADLQRAFARRLLDGDDAILDEVRDSSRTDRQTLMHVYEHAYGARLAEVLEADYEKLAAALGPDGFQAMAAAYVAAMPSDDPNARYFGRRLPAFLSDAAPWSDRPWLAELAALEWALGEVFLEADPPRLALEAMAALHPNDWPYLAFMFVDDCRRLDFVHGGGEAWLALAEDADPANAAEVGAAGPTAWLVWRQEQESQFREMSPDEAWAFDRAGEGVLFQDLCEGLAERSDPTTAAAAVAGFLRGWIEAGLVAAYRVDDGAVS